MTTKGAILFVDDEPMVRTVGERLLSRAGIETLCAEDGESALALFSQHHESLFAVILDLSMPGMSGIETFYALREISNSVPVLLSSGLPGHEIERIIKGEANADFLQKPYRWNDLAEKLRLFGWEG